MVTVEDFLLEDTMYFENTPVLSYTINYPQLKDGCNAEALKKINKYYVTRASVYENECRTNLFKESSMQLQYTKEHGYPFLPDEVDIRYKVTFNEDCILSLYFDHYMFTGGAHGSTMRYSNTWNLNTGHLIRLKDFFEPGSDYKSYVRNRINEMISKQLESSVSHPDYFKNHEQNVSISFSPDNFYLTPEGIVIYFQQYDIAPYSNGIIEFTISYEEGMKFWEK